MGVAIVIKCNSHSFWCLDVNGLLIISVYPSWMCHTVSMLLFKFQLCNCWLCVIIWPKFVIHNICLHVIYIGTRRAVAMCLHWLKNPLVMNTIFKHIYTIKLHLIDPIYATFVLYFWFAFYKISIYLMVLRDKWHSDLH